MKIVRYTPDKAQEWDAFIGDSRNGTFLFLRGYMDYHSDRFMDHSLMYYNDKGKLLAVMPANERDNKLFSHQGLTYGGMILHADTRTIQVLEMFDLTTEYLRKRGFQEWYYKQMPTVYHRMPCEEDEYALWRHNAEIISCGMSSTIIKGAKASQTKRSDSNRLQRLGYRVEYDVPFEDFWPILEDNLLRTHGLRPVHSLEEIKLLKERFPKNICCCVARNADGEVESGAVMYIYGSVAHTQYLSSSIEGKKNNTMDFLILSLAKHYLENYQYFDFGISTERDGEYLNEGLIAQKEGFGGRGIVYKQYKIKI